MSNGGSAPSIIPFAPAIFIQFGHNDEKADSTRHTDPGSTFDKILRRYVNETRAKGGDVYKRQVNYHVMKPTAGI